jgi:hypothetical protein
MTAPQFYENPNRTVYVRTPAMTEFSVVGIGPLSRCPFHLWPPGSTFRTEHPLIVGLEFWIDPQIGRAGVVLPQVPST